MLSAMLSAKVEYIIITWKYLRYLWIVPQSLFSPRSGSKFKELEGTLETPNTESFGFKVKSLL